jgi:hypothetical protein
MNKTTFVVSLIFLILIFGAHLFFGVETLRAVFQYPFLRTSQNIIFEPIVAPSVTNGPSNPLVLTDNNVLNSTSMLLSKKTQLQDINLSISTNISTSIRCSIYSGTPDSLNANTKQLVASFPLKLTSTGPADNLYQYTYTSYVPVYALSKTPGFATLSGGLITYVIEQYDPTDSTSVTPLFGYNVLGRTAVFNNTNVNIQINCITMLLVNEKVDKNRIFEMVGVALLACSFIGASYIIYKYLNNNNTFTSNFYGSSRLNKILVFMAMALYLVLNLTGMVGTFIMINHGHVGEMVESAGVFWTIFSYISGFLTYTYIIY